MRYVPRKNPEFAKSTKSGKYKILIQKTLIKNVLQHICSKVRKSIHKV